jgi:hypothetical protein
MNTVDFKGIESEGVDWIRLAQDTIRWWATVNTIMKLRYFIGGWGWDFFTS